MNGARKLIERNLAATHLCQSELSHITEKYGSIHGPGRKWLPYHNATHAEQVHDAAYAIATQLLNQVRLDAHDLPLVKIAATFHDDEQDVGPGNNERTSADAAAQKMKEYPSLFSDEDIQKAKRMIEGTEVYFDADRTMHQAAAHDDILQAILADADLSTLGLRSYALMAMHLLLEIQAKSGRITLPDSVEELPAIPLGRKDVVQFLRSQDRLITNHRFYLDVSTALFAKERARNIAVGKSLLADQEAGAPFATLYQKSAKLASGREVGIDGP
jgi:predicted metal-dependent HD superfamily phosphohydrolase